MINKDFIMAISARSWGMDHRYTWTNYYHVVLTGDVVFLTSYLEKYFSGDPGNSCKASHKRWYAENGITLEDAEVRIVMPDLGRAGSIEMDGPVVDYPESISWDDIHPEDLPAAQIDELLKALKPSRELLVSMPYERGAADWEN